MPAVAGATAGAPNPTSAFSEFNVQQRTKAKKWCASFPRDRLVVMMLAMAVGLAAIRHVEYLASDQWQISQWNPCDTSGPFSCRVLAVWEGALQRPTYQCLAQLLTPTAWSSLHPFGRTLGNVSIDFCHSVHNALSFRATLFMDDPWVPFPPLGVD